MCLHLDLTYNRLLPEAFHASIAIGLVPTPSSSSSDSLLSFLVIFHPLFQHHPDQHFPVPQTPPTPRPICIRTSAHPPIPAPRAVADPVRGGVGVLFRLGEGGGEVYFSSRESEVSIYMCVIKGVKCQRKVRRVKNNEQKVEHHDHPISIPLSTLEPRTWAAGSSLLESAVPRLL